MLVVSPVIVDDVKMRFCDHGKRWNHSFISVSTKTLLSCNDNRSNYDTNELQLALFRCVSVV